MRGGSFNARGTQLTPPLLLLVVKLRNRAVEDSETAQGSVISREGLGTETSHNRSGAKTTSATAVVLGLSEGILSGSK